MELTPKGIRLLKGITQKEVAERLKIHPQTYSKLEKNPDMFTLKQAKEFSELFGVDCDQIFFSPKSS